VSGSETIITADDIAALNRAAVARAAALARLAGSVLVVIGAVGVAAWLWLVARRLGVAGDNPFAGVFFTYGDFEFDLSFADRLDLVADAFPNLLWAAGAAGLGFGLRLVADYAVARTGGTLTGFEVGDQLAGDEPSTDARPSPGDDIRP
jgi:hypothetical protein